MSVLSWVSAGVALLSTLLAITRRRAIHCLLYLILSLLAVAVLFYTLGAPLAAALEVIIYAGAIMVLFLFALMLLDLRPPEQEEGAGSRLAPWLGAGALGAVLLAEMVYAILRAPGGGPARVTPAEVGAALFGPYLLAVELASFLLLVGLVGAFHLGRQEPSRQEPSRQEPSRQEPEGGPR
jgi:NADH-quinone oxidoreductase subunit J